MAPTLTLVVAGSRATGPADALFGAVAQHCREGTLEIIVVRAHPLSVQVGERPGVRWLSVPPDEATLPRLRGIGLAAARSRWVALTEDFCLPSPAWADAILAPLGSASAAVFGGPVDREGGRLTDWALTLCEYGRSFGGRHPGPVERLPEINIVYDLEILRRRLGSLPEHFRPSEVDAALRRHGETFWYEPAALMLDDNDRPFTAACRSQFGHGRLWAGDNPHRGRALVRLLRLLATPLLPIVTLSRVARGAWRARRTGRLLAALPHVVALLTAAALGEAVGVALGPGCSAEQWR